MLRRHLLHALGAGGVAALVDGEGEARADGANGVRLAPRAPLDLTVVDLELGDPRERALAGRVVLFLPNHLAKGQEVGLLVLLHGLGETGDRTMGAYAWVERYGLGTAYARLRRPPLAVAEGRMDLFTAPKLAALNAALAAKPFGGMVIACPYTPNLPRLGDGEIDRYASWIVDTVIPEVRRRAPVKADAAHTAIDGVSLGGYVGLEVFCRRPEAFGAWGSLQGAFGVARAASYADRLIAAVNRRGGAQLHVETTDGDVFREGSTALAARVNASGIPCELAVLPGQHDQVFLRESGTLEMLLFHDRVLAR